MSLFAQHGWNKSDKIEIGLRASIIQGVVLSPRFERPTNLHLFTRQLRMEFGERVTIIFDPQFYVAALPEARAGALAHYPYFQEGLTRGDFRPSRVREYVEQVLSYQRSLPVDRLVAPTVFVEDVRSRWSQIGLNLAHEAQEYSERERIQHQLYASLVIDESVLKHRDSIDELLEEMTSWSVRGVLVTVRCADTRYPALLSEIQIANLMYLIYVLADRNEFEVVCTHSDFVSLLFHVVGACATSTGWFNTQRQFSLKAFEPPTRGGRARDRYTSAALLNSVLVIPELSSIVSSGLGPNVVAGTPFDAAIARDPGNAPWSQTQACLHHWAVLTGLIAEITSLDTVRERLEVIERWIAKGIDLYRTIKESGVEFEETTGPRNLEQWRRALQSFKEEVRE